jgi:hypothetical protein
MANCKRLKQELEIPTLSLIAFSHLSLDFAPV